MSDTKKCPYCAEDIKVEANKCKHCGEWLNSTETSSEDNTNQFDNKKEKQKNSSVAIKQCRRCKEEIKKEATSCPYCGEKDQTGIYAALGGIVLFSLPFLFLGPLYIPAFLVAVILIWRGYKQRQI